MLPAPWGELLWQFQSLLACHPSGVPLPELPLLWQQRFGLPFNPIAYGMANIDQVLHIVSGVCHVQMINNVPVVFPLPPNVPRSPAPVLVPRPPPGPPPGTPPPHALTHGMGAHAPARLGSVDPSVLEAIFEEVCKGLYNKGEWAFLSRVSTLMCEQLGIQGGLSQGIIGDLPSHPFVKDFLEREKQVELCIVTYLSTRYLATLWDLESYVVHVLEVSEFKDLGLGSLLGHPLVREAFDITQNVQQVHEVSVLEVLEVMSENLDKDQQVHREGEEQHMDLDWPSVLQVLAERHHVEDVRLLGVRLTQLTPVTRALILARQAAVPQVRFPQDAIRAQVEALGRVRSHSPSPASELIDLCSDSEVEDDAGQASSSMEVSSSDHCVGGGEVSDNDSEWWEVYGKEGGNGTPELVAVSSGSPSHAPRRDTEVNNEGRSHEAAVVGQQEGAAGIREEAGTSGLELPSLHQMRPLPAQGGQEPFLTKKMKRKLRAEKYKMARERKAKEKKSGKKGKKLKGKQGKAVAIAAVQGKKKTKAQKFIKQKLQNLRGQGASGSGKQAVEGGRKKGYELLRSQAALMVDPELMEEDHPAAQDDLEGAGSSGGPRLPISNQELKALGQRLCLEEPVTSKVLLDRFQDDVSEIFLSKPFQDQPDAAVKRVARLLSLYSGRAPVGLNHSKMLDFWQEDVAALLLLHTVKQLMIQKGDGMPQESMAAPPPTSDVGSKEPQPVNKQEDAVGALCAAIQEVRQRIGDLKPVGASWTFDAVEGLRVRVEQQLGPHCDWQQLGAVVVVLKYLLDKHRSSQGAKADTGPAGGDKGKASAAAAGPDQEGTVSVKLDDQVVKDNVMRHLTERERNLLGLAELEQQMVKEFGLEAFRLQDNAPVQGKTSPQWGSLLQLLATDAELSALVEQGLAMVPLEEVLMVVVQTLVALDAVKAGPKGLEVQDGSDVQQGVAASLCRHYGVTAVEDLGHGSVARLLRKCLVSGQHIGGSQPPSALSHNLGKSIVSLAALMATRGSSSGSNDVGVPGLPLSAPGGNDALTCLQAAPHMVDLEQWSCWEQVFAPSLGPMKRFLLTHGSRGGLTVLEVPQGRNFSGGLFRGHYVKVPAVGDEVNELLGACDRGDASGLIGVILGIIVTSGGVDKAPLPLLTSHLHGALRAMALGHDSGGDEGQGPEGKGDEQARLGGGRGAQRAVQFVLRCLLATPCILLPRLFEHLLFPPLAALLGGSSLAHHALLSMVSPSQSGHCRTGSMGRSLLHYLGLAVGVVEWQEDWLKCCSGQTEVATSVIEVEEGHVPSVTTSGGVEGAPACKEEFSLPDLLSHMEPQEGKDKKTVTEGTATDLGREGLMTVPGGMPDAPEDSGLPARQEGGEAITGRLCGAAGEPWGVVEAIRREEFGLGVVLDPEGCALRERQNKRIGRALQRLSQELYSQDSHFVLELVQNADDNRYPCGVVPALEFILYGDRIVVVNNEVGFAEKDIRALCDVGRSTKSRTLGYIGQKGIGFKSVFRITDRPEVHSNGYHVAFDLTRHPSLGYILPTWVGDEGNKQLDQTSNEGAQNHDSMPHAGRCSSGEPLGGQLKLNSGATRIVLPLKQAMETLEDSEVVAVDALQLQPAALRQRFEDVQPTLLLFLQKLRCIAITDTLRPRHNTIMLKRSLGPNLVELRHGNKAEQTARWMVVRSKVKPPVPRLDVHLPETEVCLAFNLEGPSPWQQQAFAFLPLRGYGLRFVVQGDFVVPSSREAVDCDNTWNLMIRSEVPSLFIKALGVFQSLDVPSDKDKAFWLNRWLQCVPVVGEAQGFFSPLPHTISARLRAAKCIMSEEGTMIAPSEAMVSLQPQVTDLISPQLLLQLMGKQYVHRGLTSIYTSPGLRSLLGVEEISSHQILELLKKMVQEGRVKELGYTWLARMLCCIFDMLEGSGGPYVMDRARRSEILSDLRQLEVLPLQGGTYVSLQGTMGRVFFPLESEILPLETTGPSKGGHLRPPISFSGGAPTGTVSQEVMEALRLSGLWGFRDQLGLQVLSPELLAAVPEDRVELLVRGLKEAGVKVLEARDIMRVSLVPVLYSSFHLTRRLMVAMLAFPLLAGIFPPAVTHKEDQDMLAQICKQGVVLVLNKGRKKVKGGAGEAEGGGTVSPIYLPANLGGELTPFVSSSLAPLMDTCMLAETYGQRFPILKDKWIWWFEQLGLLRLPPLQVHTQIVGPVAAGYEGVDLGPQGPSGQWVIQEKRCLEMEGVLKEILERGDEADRHHMVGDWLRLVADYWGHFKDMFQARAWPALPPDGQGQSRSEECVPGHSQKVIPSAFAVQLRGMAWLPSSAGSLRRPDALYLPSASVTSVLGSLVPYFQCKRRAHGEGNNPTMPEPNVQELLAIVGVQTELSPETVVNLLSTWGSAKGLVGRSQQRLCQAFTASLSQMKGVYQYLAGNIPGGALVGVLDSIWLPPCKKMSKAGETVQDEHQQVPGHFYSLSRLCCSDPSDALEEALVQGILSDQYHGPTRNIGKYYPQEVVQRLSPGEPQCTNSASPVDRASEVSGGLDQSNWQPVMPQPSAWNYCMLLSLLSDATSRITSPADASQVPGIILRILKQISQMWEQDPSLGGMWDKAKPLLMVKPLLRSCNHRNWVALKQRPLWNDDAAIGALFWARPEVHLLMAKRWMISSCQTVLEKPHLEDTVENSLVLFLKALGVERLSHLAVRCPTWMGERVSEPMTLALAAVLPYVQRYLYWTLTPEGYKVVDSKVRALLETFRVCIVRELSVKYKVVLDGPLEQGPTCRMSSTAEPPVPGTPISDCQPVISEAVSVPMVLHGSTLYVMDGSQENLNDLCMEFSRLFHDDQLQPSLGDLMYTLMLTLSSGVDVEDFMIRKGCHELPESEINLETGQEGPGELPVWSVTLPQPLTTSESSTELGDQDPPSVAGAGRPDDISGGASSAQLLKRAASSPPTSPTSSGDHPNKRPRLSYEREAAHTMVSDSALALAASQVDEDLAPLLKLAEEQQNPQTSTETRPTWLKAFRPGRRSTSYYRTFNKGGLKQGITDFSNMVPVASGSLRWLPWTVKAHANSLAMASRYLSQVQVPKEVLASVKYTPEGHMKDRMQQTGRYGEELVYKHLVHELESSGVEVNWANEVQESRGPYDIALKYPDGRDIFVEVKSTTSTNKMNFEISHAEFQMAADMGEQFEVYRVFGVGTKDVKVLRIKDPLKCWQLHIVNICLSI